LAEGKLDGLLGEGVETPKPEAKPKVTVTTHTPGKGGVRRTMVIPDKPPMPKRVTAREDYRAMVPSARTPHAYSKPVADEKLRNLVKSVRVKGDDAIYTADMWDSFLGEVARVALDLMESGGLVVKDKSVSSKVRVALGRIMREDMEFAEEDGTYKRVVIE
jgi:hypothetical protein